jgi:hypothetical protein
MERLRESLADAETVLNLARTGAPLEETGRLERERELRALKARAEDQAGEIARLKAALAAFEKAQDDGTGLKNSRLALGPSRLRRGPRRAPGRTINRLRAELAAAHRRLPRSRHFMDGCAASGQARSPLRAGATVGWRSTGATWRVVASADAQAEVPTVCTAGRAEEASG